MYSSLITKIGIEMKSMFIYNNYNNNHNFVAHKLVINWVSALKPHRIPFADGIHNFSESRILIINPIPLMHKSTRRRSLSPSTQIIKTHFRYHKSQHVIIMNERGSYHTPPSPPHLSFSLSFSIPHECAANNSNANTNIFTWTRVSVLM